MFKDVCCSEHLYGLCESSAKMLAEAEAETMETNMLEPGEKFQEAGAGDAQEGDMPAVHRRIHEVQS